MSESRSPEALGLRTNAKVNLFLEVKARRADGYHEIETVFHSISLADTVEVARRPGAGITVDLRPERIRGEDLPRPEDNIVTHALHGFARRAERPIDLHVGIRKVIPIAAGLAGGSANAAGALVAANELYGGPLTPTALREVAGEVGSDVPFCIVGGTALASGRGELISGLQGPELHLVLGLSRERLPTRAVYERVRPGEADGPAAGDLVEALEEDDLSALAGLLRNDLERAALELMPVLAERKDALLRAGGLGALLCGSGPGIFSIARDEGHARALAAAVRDVFDRVEVVRSRPSGVERS